MRRHLTRFVRHPYNPRGKAESTRLQESDGTVTERRQEGDLYRLSVNGQIDLSTVPELKQALLDAIDAGGRHIIIELSRVRYMDSSGFGVLLGATKRLRPAGGQLYLVGCTEPIARLLQITRLNTIFELYESEEVARRAIAAVHLLENSFGPAGPASELTADGGDG